MVFGCLCAVVVFGAVLPMFLLHCVVLFSRKLSEYFLFFSVVFCGKFSGANFGYLAFVVVLCILVLFLRMFLFYYVVLFSRKLSEKIFLASGLWFFGKFSGANFGCLGLALV